MTPFEFLGYEPTPAEKHLGIVTIRAWGKIILKYKAVARKEGGFFLAVATVRNSLTQGSNQELYDKCFMIDSNYDVEQLDRLVRKHVDPFAQQTSAFAQQAVNPANSGLGSSQPQNAQFSAKQEEFHAPDPNWNGF